MPTIDAIRHRLLARRRELLTRYRDELERVEEELSARTAEVVESSAEEWDARVVSSLGDSDVRALLEVVEALRRLEAGRYGTCTECDAPIAAARLEVKPEAALCIDCAASHERPVARSA
ncbi:MAG: TraR/DksA C4-type zinc finger protein [Myxococcales bacterium]|nr:TraR/DksA C4-type zinc finger protein [Myxococcales bacterium]